MRARLPALLVAALVAAPGGLVAQVAVRGETVYTMAGAPIRDGVVIVRDGRITEVGPAAQVRIPEGFRVLTARVVTPGLIDAHTVVGLAGALNHDHDQDQLERSSAIQPDLRAYDAYNAQDVLVGHLRKLGITTIHTGHGPGALMSGQTMIVKTRGTELMPETIVDSARMLVMTLGPEVSQVFSGRSPSTRSKGVAMVREQFIKAQEHQRKVRAAGNDASKLPPRDLNLETLVRVLDGRMPVLLTAHRVPEILAALRLADEFKFKLVLDGASEAHMVVDQIKRAGVPVILHPSMIRLSGGGRNASLETANTLRQAGIPVAFQSGYEAYVPKSRVVLYEAAMTLANGLAPEHALAAITIDAARIIGAEKRIGSLERGKDGDLALFDGDPFEYTTKVCGVVIDGRVVSESCN